MNRQNKEPRSLIRSSWQSIGFYRQRKRRRGEKVVVKIEWRR